MADLSGSVDPSRFSCSLCLQLFTDPVTVPCGHSFCMGCLSKLWDGDQSSTCPQCRASFSPRPALGTNLLLLELVQSLSAVRLNPAPSAPPLTCFQHPTFDISAVQPERSGGERLLGETRRTLAQQIAQKETERHQLQNAVKAFSRQVKTATKDSSKIFSELLDFVERRRVEMKELIRTQEKAEITRAENRLQRLEREISELRSREAQLEKLSHSGDQQLVTQMCVSLGRPVSAGSPVVNPNVSFGSVRKAILDLKQQLETVYHQELPTVTAAVTSVNILQMEIPSKGASESAHIPALDSREGLLQYACPVTVDPFTAHRELTLSAGNRAVGRKGELHSYAEHPERFDCWAQALSHEGLTGRSYWEAEWDGTQVALGVAYNSIGRKGSSNDSRLGHNSHSWCLKCSPSSFSFCHENREQQVVVPDSTVSRRIALFLDHGSGLLCFFTVTQEGVHLVHRLENHFTQPLYAAVWLGSNSSVTFQN